MLWLVNRNNDELIDSGVIDRGFAFAKDFKTGINTINRTIIEGT